MKKCISILAVAMMALTTAFAQENNNRDAEGNIVRGPYLTNGFGDNWFIGIGGGANFTVGKETKFSFGGPAIDINIGKWFTPSVGARFGYRGLKNSFDLKDGYTTLIDKGDGNWKASHYVHGDLLWNVSNAFSGYKETRTWDVIPYATAGWQGLKDPYYATLNGNNHEIENEWVVGIGILNKFRISDKVGLYLDVSALSTRHEVLVVSPHKDGNYFVFMPSVLGGIYFNLGRTNWDRLSSLNLSAPVTVTFTEADYKALESKLNTLEAQKKTLIADLEAERAKEPEKIVVTAEAKKQVVLFFDLAKNTLNANELAHLKAFASKLSPDAKLTVTGSADSGTGSEAINTKLAESRAKVVIDILVNQFGIKRENITMDHVFDLFGNNPQSRATMVE